MTSTPNIWDAPDAGDIVLPDRHYAKFSRQALSELAIRFLEHRSGGKLPEGAYAIWSEDGTISVVVPSDRA